jgi:hypothetical protein
MGKFLGWFAIIGLGALFYAQYRESQKRTVKVKK